MRKKIQKKQKKNSKVFLVFSLIFLLCSLFFALSLLHTKQDTRSKAQASTTLSLTPSSFQKNVGDTFTSDVMVDPGSNQVSLVKMVISYDPTKVATAAAMTINTDAFPEILEGPFYQPGKIMVTVGIGSNAVKVITTPTKVATITMKALAATDTMGSTITFMTPTEVYSLAPADSPSENVLSTFSPASVMISTSGTSITPTITPSVSPVACQLTTQLPTDIMLVTDVSDSMKNAASASDPTSKLEAAKTAAGVFVDEIAAHNPNDLIHVGLASFAGMPDTISEMINSSLGSDFQSLKNSINNLGIINYGGTCIECGIKAAEQEFKSHGRTNARKVVVLLTDGRANATVNEPYQDSSNPGADAGEQAAQTAAMSLNSTYGAVFYTIGLGKDVNSSFLTTMASSTGGQYYFAPSSTQLNSIYQEISIISSKASISGITYVDANNNGRYDSGEQVLPNTPLIVTGGSLTQPVRLNSDATGQYTISNLCDGTYTIKQVTVPGFAVSTPPSGVYVVTITNTQTVTDKNFGNIVGTYLSLTVNLHGIGTSGDNPNPGTSSLSNRNPLHPTRNLQYEITNSANQLVASGSETMTYATQSGKFTSLILIHSPLTTGIYELKIKSDKYLKQLVTGIQTFVQGSTNTVAETSLTAGDVNNDNWLNILDYNTLLDCGYAAINPKPMSDASSLYNSAACKAHAERANTDLDDNGIIDHKDFNLFIRELSIQHGD